MAQPKLNRTRLMPQHTVCTLFTFMFFSSWYMFSFVPCLSTYVRTHTTTNVGIYGDILFTNSTHVVQTTITNNKYTFCSSASSSTSFCVVLAKVAFVYIVAFSQSAASAVVQCVNIFIRICSMLYVSTPCIFM